MGMQHAAPAEVLMAEWLNVYLRHDRGRAPYHWHGTRFVSRHDADHYRIPDDAYWRRVYVLRITPKPPCPFAAQTAATTARVHAWAAENVPNWKEQP